MQFKKTEVGIVILCLLFGVIWLTTAKATSVSGDVVIIELKGTEKQSYTLDKNQIITVEGKKGTYNKIKIEDGSVYMQEADCENQICVHHHAICNTNESIVCIPNEVVVTVQKEQEQMEVDAIAE